MVEMLIIHVAAYLLIQPVGRRPGWAVTRPITVPTTTYTFCFMKYWVNYVLASFSYRIDQLLLFYRTPTSIKLEAIRNDIDPKSIWVKSVVPKLIYNHLPFSNHLPVLDMNTSILQRLL